jgi:hypothetical protein
MSDPAEAPSLKRTPLQARARVVETPCYKKKKEVAA